MANQMSPPPPQRPGYSVPYQQQPAHSPPGIALPPAKRPRLSPGAGSPQSPQVGFPESPYGPYPPRPSIANSTPMAFNAPQPIAASPPLGSMGPPPKPTPEQKAAKEKEEKEKVTDISDISDAMWGSGVDLREEENYLSSTSRAIYGSNSSFDSQSTIPSANNSFNLLTQGLSTGQLSGSGPVSQPSSSMEDIQAEVDRKHQDAALKYATEHEVHLRNPFLLGNGVRHKMHRIGLDQGVHLDVRGLYDPPKAQIQTPQTPQGVHGVVAKGPGDTAIAAIQTSTPAEAQHAFLDKEEGARYADILSLVSLAANERLRILMDEAFTISRSRQIGSQGGVQPDFKGLATGEQRRSTSVKPESITNTPWDRPSSRDGGDGDEKQDTISFTAAIASHLSSLAISEHSAESQRIKRRADRAARLKAAADPASAATSNGAGTPSTPAPTTPAAISAGGAVTDSPAAPGSLAPDKPLTKKERERAAKAGQTEEVLHKNANVTAAMQLGFGKKAKRYSWMSGGAAAEPSNPFKPNPPSRNPSALSGGAGKTDRSSGSGKDPSAAAKKAGGDGLGKDRKFGVWKEDGPDGKGVQLRDLLAVLGRDRRTAKMLERVTLKLGDEPGPNGTAAVAAAATK